MESEPAINFSSLKEHARRQIIDIIDRAPGPKFLALDPSLSGPLSIIIEMSVLKDHGVSKVMAVGSGELDFDTREVIYIVRPTIEMMKIISKQVSDNIKNKEDHRYSLYMCPRVTTVCENILTSDQVLETLTILSPWRFTSFRLKWTCFRCRLKKRTEIWYWKEISPCIIK